MSQKGKDFETKVRDVLYELREKHPDVVRINEQLHLELYDGQEVIPDFELQFDLLFQEGRYLIECQHRKRSSPQIAQKIKYMKGLSSRNRFIFVYATNIPQSTIKALRADGVLQMAFENFVLFIKRLDIQLINQKKIEKQLLDELEENPDSPKYIPPVC